MGGRLLELHVRVRELIHDEIRRTVADAINGDEILHTGPLVDRLVKTYGHCGWSSEQIEQEIIVAASRAGVAVEMCRPKFKRAS